MSCSGYVVEKCEVDSGDFWEKLPQSVSSPTFNVKDLIPGKKYKFRVRAENMYGVGEPSEGSQAILAKNPYGILRLRDRIDTVPLDVPLHQRLFSSCLFFRPAK